MYKEDFKKRLQILMEREGIKSQYALAKRLGIKLSVVNNWFTGVSRFPRDKYLMVLTSFFGVSPAWLRYGEPEQAPNLESEAQKLAEEIASYGDQGIRKARQFLKILEEDKALDIRPLRRYKKAG